MANYSNILSKFNNKNILVVGDVILDQYIRGNVSRISPEAPVPIVLEEESFYKPGGSANVAHNISSLGANVIQVGKIGDDPEGLILVRELKDKDINTDGLFIDKTMPTISKTRIIAQHQQIVRIDRERVKGAGDPAVQSKIFEFIKRNIDKVHAIILSDYGKGLITSDLVSFVCSLAVSKKKIITVDPKVEHFSYYKKVTGITPNKKEAENAIRDIKIRDAHGDKLGINHDQLDSMELVDQAGAELLRYLDLESLLITLGEHGMRLFERGKKPVSIKTQAREVFDVTGAGDTVISVFTLALTAGATKREAAELANFAAGVVVGKLGAAAVTKEEILEAMKK